jgi:signal peptidase II
MTPESKAKTSAAPAALNLPGAPTVPPSRLYFWAVGLGVLALDWLSKLAVVHNLQPYQSLQLLGDYVQLTYVRNAGGAFSLLAHSTFAWRPFLFIGIAAATMVVLAVIAHREKGAGLGFLIPLGMICGGAAGNLVDRVTVGTVVDFIEVGVKAYHWPVFNLADSAIDIGVVWLLFVNLRPGRKPGGAA